MNIKKTYIHEVKSMSELNFRINKNKFYNGLTAAARAISSNSPMPALTGVLMDVKEDEIHLIGSDADISIEVTLNNAMDQDLNLSVVTPGSIVIDSRYLLDIVKKIDSDTISIEIIDGTLTRFSGTNAEYKINGYRPEDYPVIDFTEPENKFTISSETLSQIISQTIFAASGKETRPVLTGLNIKTEENNVICTATDSYRLAKKTVAVQAPAFATTVPARSMNEVKNIFNDKDVEVAVSPKKIQFRSGAYVLQSTLLEGNYPETDRLIPSEFSRTLIINRFALIQAVDRTSFIKTDNMPIIRMQINSADDIVISNKNQEIGESRESLKAVSYDGEPLDISFAGNYILDAAKALSTENIRICFTGEMKPFILRNDNEDDSILQLVLPVRTYN